eukprot:CAMPEP_0119302814 /NCGR_PEP_ID=MMETSP1333-20130426/4354_1 /TAXON_ID=418940 /ORGANISM="Scyphosphaera apsteinii, Strain RCC1455" /LENGTH=96 /DNA_ID=CAMNT_0007305289 /DNA_START=240 /DNA_END=530 /DNA_ORIENTATION=+
MSPIAPLQGPAIMKHTLSKAVLKYRHSGLRKVVLAATRQTEETHLACSTSAARGSLLMQRASISAIAPHSMNRSCASSSQWTVFLHSFGTVPRSPA